MTADRAIWAYAITCPTVTTDLSMLSGVASVAVRPVHGPGLTMLVSIVPLAEFGEAALRRNLENLAWVDEVARAHHHVVEVAARLFPLLPMRLATVYSSERAAVAVLAQRCLPLHAALRRVTGRVEWGVKAYPVPDANGEKRPVPQDPGAGAGAGTAYLKRRRTELAAGRESRAAAVAAARAVHAALTARAEWTKLHPPQPPQLNGTRLPALLNASYLIDAGDANAFASAVCAAADAHPELAIELTGPWPPYSFVGEVG